MKIITNKVDVFYNYNSYELYTSCAIAFELIERRRSNLMNYNTYCVKTTNVTLVGDVLTLVIPVANYNNLDIVKICVCQPIPTGILPTTTVSIQFEGGAVYPTETSCGNFIYGDRVRSRACYSFRVATDTEKFTYNGGCHLRCTTHVFTNPLPTAVAVQAVAKK